MKHTFGIVSYNIYCNFTNYGSALQSWALSQSVARLGHHAKLIDYCPDVLKDADPLNPFKLMWDKDPESRRLCEMTMPAIRENYAKFDRFYHDRFVRTKKYTAANFNEIVADEHLDGFICGSDTIFCIDEFKGFDDGYYANYPVMRNGYTISYAASFGDAHFDESTYATLNDRLRNFKALGIRENRFLDYVKAHVNVPVKRTIDPTLLLTASDYDTIAVPRIVREKYLLLYSRRYDKAMFEYAEELAAKNGWTVVDISLRADNAGRHRMFYQAGVEEFLSLVKHAEFVVTNSFHGLIFAVQYRRPFFVFSREQCDNKIDEVLALFGMSDRKIPPGGMGGGQTSLADPDFGAAHARIAQARSDSLAFLRASLDGFD